MIFNTLSWIIVVAFAVLLTLTILGMIGVVNFKQKEHLNKLFIVLVLEVIALAFITFKKGPEKDDWLLKVEDIYARAEVQYKNKNYQEALSTVDSVFFIKTDPKTIGIKDVFLLKGNISYDLKQWVETINNLKIYNEIEPNNVDVLAKLGRSYREILRYEEAEQVYKRAIDIKPNNYQIKSGLFNCLRRHAAFVSGTGRESYSNELFKKARLLVLEMIELAKKESDENIRKRKLLNAKVAQSRLNWEWKRYDEAIALMKGISVEFPDFGYNLEDLAAVQLEFGELTNNQSLISESLKLYTSLYNNDKMDEVSKIYSGAGVAEATALILNPSKNQIDFALNSVNLSIAKNEKIDDDPYPFYAKAILYHKTNQIEEAIDYIEQAIKHERARSDDPYTFDYDRLLKYELLLKNWKKIHNKV